MVEANERCVSTLTLTLTLTPTLTPTLTLPLTRRVLQLLTYQQTVGVLAIVLSAMGNDVIYFMVSFLRRLQP